MDGGTQFLPAEDLAKHFTSKELKVKTKKENIAGLQIADLIAHTARRYAFKTIFGLDDKKITFSDSIIKILTDIKFFRYKEKILNYGVKKLP